MFIEDCLKRALEGGPIFPVWTVVDHGRGNGMRLGACEPRRIRPVRDHQRDLGGIGALLRRLDQRGHVGAATGDQDGDALLDHALTAFLPTARSTPVSASLRPVSAIARPSFARAPRYLGIRDCAMA